MRRRYQRARDPDLREVFRAHYARSFVAYKRGIRHAKDVADRALCVDITSRNLYGRPFQIAFAKQRSPTCLPPLETPDGTLTTSVQASAELLLHSHVAVDDPAADSDFHSRIRALAGCPYPATPDDHSFTLPEIEHAMLLGNLRAAPGLDGLTGISRPWKHLPGHFLLEPRVAILIGGAGGTCLYLHPVQSQRAEERTDYTSRQVLNKTMRMPRVLPGRCVGGPGGLLGSLL
ncbi:hypothetical protein HPB49_006304 [Dermacentor silvarum]|uniref:Uncharacterized protein n=1 Tax=Dermacentor silvarum TaxID=543639 RepID=A0ACB8DWK1_DERSI|nr:hypothetical protein HPB49_006304 [Dermacentor silvarum]